jgi:PAS domain S-box-containing protein
MTTFFSVPDKEKDYQSYMVYTLTLIWSVVTVAIVSIGFVALPQMSLRWLAALLTSLAIAVFNLTLNYFGYTRLASWTLPIMLWLSVTIPTYSAGGIFAPGILSQMSVILTAGFLLGWRGGLAIGLLSVGVDFWLAYSEMVGTLPAATATFNPIHRWVGAVIPFGTLLALQYYSTSHLRTSLLSLQREMAKRKEAEKTKDKALFDLTERVKELTTLYTVSQILHNEDMTASESLHKVVEIIPSGWQYSDIAAARICVAEKEYKSENYQPSDHTQQAEMKTASGTKVLLEVVYRQLPPHFEKDPFLKEETKLIKMLTEMLRTDQDRRERNAELRDYKYALDVASIISISEADGSFSFINDNFCKASKYTRGELSGKHHSMIWSGYHSPEYFEELKMAMQHGKAFRGEFCNLAKDGSIYWVDASIVPFLDENNEVYQYLSINHDITERKEAEEKIRENERLIKKITSQVPGNTYMFEIEENGDTKIIFSNRGTDTFNHTHDQEELIERPEALRELLHEDDKSKFSDAMKGAYKTLSSISLQYRIIVADRIRWRWMQAVPEKSTNGKTTWYGATSDITPLVDYIASIEQILYDISHVIRRPISSMLGLTQLIADGDLSEQEIKEMSSKLHVVSEEMDSFVRELNLEYNKKRQSTNFAIDVSTYLDKRGFKSY